MLSRRDKDLLSPHKISILLLIEKYSNIIPNSCKSENDDQSFLQISLFKNSPAERKTMCTLIAKLLQGSEMNLTDLLGHIENSGLSQDYIDAFKRGLQELYKKGIETFLSLFDSVEAFSSPDPGRTNMYSCLWTSLVGLHLRQINLAFRRLSFSHVVSLYQKFQQYYEQCHKEIASMDQSSMQDSSNFREVTIESDIEMEQSSDAHIFLTPKDTPSMLKPSVTEEKEIDNSFDAQQPEKNLSNLNPASHTMIGTKQQAELFIQEQISYLLMQSPKALPPKELQDILSVMLKNCPDLGKGHFLSYLNCLRVREYAGAMHSLVRAYDDAKLMQKDTGKGEDITRTFRYASLSMAALQSQFNHSELGLTALEEAIRLSQESSDHVCLQYALAWLYSLSPNQKGTLMKRSHNRSSDINLGYLSWLSLLNYTLQLSNSTKPPSELLKRLLGSSPANSNKKALEGGVQGQAGIWGLQAALWSAWGNFPLTAICSQLVLHMGPQAIINLHAPSSENSTCVAICNIALILANLGEFGFANAVISHAQAQYPSPWEHSKQWMFTQAYVRFQEHLIQGHWSLVKSLVNSMATTHPQQAKLLESILLSCRGEYSQALETVSVLKESPSSLSVPHFQVECLIAEAEALAGGNNFGAALSTLVKAVSVAQDHHLAYLAAIGNFHMASVQMHLGFLKEAQSSIDKGLDVVRSGGGMYDRARAKLLQAKLKVRSAKNDEKHEALVTAAQLLTEVQTLFKQIKAFPRLKETIYLKARFYHEAGLYDERNKCALEFRQLEQQHPGFPIVSNTAIF